MKKILVPTDFSNASLSALKIAAHLAKRRQNIRIKLSHTYKVPRVPSVTNQDFGYDVRKQNEIRTGFKKQFAEIAAMDFVKGVRVETQLVPHMDVIGLLGYKENEEADLIICGVHGKKDWHKTVEGTKTEAIIRHAKCPVLCVHENIPEPIKFDDIVFASDFSEESYTVFPKLKKILDVLNGRIHLVKIITPHQFETTLHAEKEMKEFAKRNFLTNFTTKVFNDNNVELGIHRYAYSINANMIAMETHGQDGFLKYLKGSILESVAHHTDLPLLSMRMNA